MAHYSKEAVRVADKCVKGRHRTKR
jgi:hypothetical protein